MPSISHPLSTYGSSLVQLPRPFHAKLVGFVSRRSLVSIPRPNVKARELPYLADLKIAPFATLSLGKHRYPQGRVGVGEAVPCVEIEVPAIYVDSAQLHHRLRAGLASSVVIQN